MPQPQLELEWRDHCTIGWCFANFGKHTQFALVQEDGKTAMIVAVVEDQGTVHRSPVMYDTWLEAKRWCEAKVGEIRANVVA